MNSKVLRLWEFRNEPIPQDCCGWGVTPPEIDQQLQLLARNHAQLEERETAAEFDAVRCRVQNWTLPVTVVYPGRNLHPELESAVLGSHVGEQKEVALESGTVTLTVERICAYVSAPIDDALIQAEKIHGIKTVEAYKVWWEEQENARRFQHNGLRIAYEILKKMGDNSELYIDEEEMEAALRKRAQLMHDSMVEAGLPVEMLDSVEDMVAGFRKNLGSFFYPKFLHPYVVEHLRREPIEAVMGKAVEVFAEINHYDPADVRRDMEQYPDYKEMVITVAAQIVLCETYINEKLKEVK